jgi:hypothetical protein
MRNGIARNARNNLDTIEYRSDDITINGKKF